MYYAILCPNEIMSLFIMARSKLIMADFLKKGKVKGELSKTVTKIEETTLPNI